MGDRSHFRICNLRSLAIAVGYVRQVSVPRLNQCRRELVYERYFKVPYPARTTIAVAALR